MPTQLPRESTEFFGTLLMPHIDEMIKLDANKEFSMQMINSIVKNVSSIKIHGS
jgi:alpha-aminoadipic semialdehyde synthase